MGVGDVPQSLRRKQTDAFIEYRPSSVVVNRSDRVSDGQGGWTRAAPTLLPPQTLRIVQKSDVRAQMRVTSEGQEVLPAWRAVGPADIDLEVFDWFQVGTRKFEVVHIKEHDPETGDDVVAELWEVV